MGFDYDKMSQRESFGTAKARAEKSERLAALKHQVERQHNKQSREDFVAEEQAVQDGLRGLTAKYRASFSQEDEDNLSQFCQKNNMRFEVIQSYQKDERSEIARMVFDGAVECVYNGLSGTFENVKTFPFKYPEVDKSQYNLEDSSLWKLMKQFPELAAIEDRIKEGLAKSRFPADKLSELNLNDFKYVMYTYCDAQNDTVKKSYDMRPVHKIFPETDENGNIMHDRKGKVVTTSAKKRFTIDFINKHPEFADMMMKVPGARQDYVDELVGQMKRGSTDMTYFLRDHPEWKDQMAINIHHIINIKDIRNLEAQGRNLGEINEESNLCVMGCGTLQQVIERKNNFDARNTELEGAHGSMHNSDTTVKLSKVDEYGNEKRSYKAARIFPPYGAVCMLSHNSEHIMIDENIKQRQMSRGQNRENGLSNNQQKESRYE